MAAAELALQIPTARLSSSRGNAALIRAIVLGIRRAPKAPWSPLIAITPPTEPITATPTDDKVNPATPIRKIRFRPKRSPELAARDKQDGQGQQIGVGDPLQGP